MDSELIADNAILAGLQLYGLSKALRHPDRAILRLLLWARAARRDPAKARQQYLTFLSVSFGVNAVELADEYRRSGFARSHAARVAELRRYPGTHRMGTTSAGGCEALYLLVRAVKPRQVVETGVLYGGSSAHILAALERNGGGNLYSIDLARAPEEPPHDFLVPRELTGDGSSSRETAG